MAQIPTRVKRLDILPGETKSSIQALDFLVAYWRLATVDTYDIYLPLGNLRRGDVL